MNDQKDELVQYYKNRINLLYEITKKTPSLAKRSVMKRVIGIEPACSACKAEVIPVNTPAL